MRDRPETTETKPMLRALAGTASARPPIWLMRQAGRYLPEYRAVRARMRDFLDLCLTPDAAVEVTLQPVQRFGLDAAILFSDILMVPYGLGQNLGFRDGEGPVLEAVRASGGIGLLAAGLAALTERLAPVYEAIGGVRAELPDNVALIGFAGAPWTVATYMVEGGTSRDFQHVRLWSCADPDGFGRLIDLLVEATVAHLDRQLVAGAEVVQLFDSWAGILSEDGFRRWVIEPTRRIVARLRANHPGRPIIGFPRGAGMMAETYFTETGVTALGLDTMMPLAAARVLQRIGPVQGNLDPVLLLAGGDLLLAESRRILASLSDGPFVFNLGHGVLPQTPVGHVERLVELLRHG